MTFGRAIEPEPVESELSAPLSVGEAFRIALPNFEGPLDLLLHLIREHRVNILDIPIALITEKYLEHLTRMKEIDLDIAGEFLVMAATLAHIKSRLLLPRQEVQADPDSEDQKDPRAELVRRLLEYQKYRESAETLAKQDILDRNVFTRKAALEPVPPPDGELNLVEVSVYKLIEALDRALEAAAPKLAHEVIRERVSLSDAIHLIADRLRSEGTISFFKLFEGKKGRQHVVATFLALLEMCRLRLIRIHQDAGGPDILVSSHGQAQTRIPIEEVDELEYK